MFIDTLLDTISKRLPSHNFSIEMSKGGMYHVICDTKDTGISFTMNKNSDASLKELAERTLTDSLSYELLKYCDSLQR